MSTIKLNGTTSGSSIIKAPDSGSTNQTFTLPASSGTLVTTTDAGVAGITSSADATAITIDSSENVGIGATPESWNSSFTALQIGGNSALWGETVAGAGKGLELTQNIYYDTGSLKYLSTDEASRHYQRNGTHVFEVAPSGSADSAITFTTGLEVLNDGKARAKNGLLFGTDTAEDNTLDDYEEGDWTPTCTAFTIGSIPSAKYIRIGRLVYLQAYLEITNNSGNANGVVIGGLPFSVASHGWSTGAVNMSNGNSTVNNLHVRAYSSSGDVNVKKNHDTIMLGNEVDAGHFIFSLTYKV